MSQVSPMSDGVSRRDVLKYFGAAATTAPFASAESASAVAWIRTAAGSAVLSAGGYANQNAYGPSAKALAAVRVVSADAMCRYSQAAVERLRVRLAETHQVAPAQVALGCGSTELFRLMADAFLGPGKKLVIARPTCPLLATAAAAAGADVTPVPLAPNHSHDLRAMLEACDGTTGLVYICNPNNPTGTVTRRADIDAFLAKLPSHTIAVIDEAYLEYVEPSPESLSFLDRPATGDRAIVLRTFSKIHGLAGLRVGYAITSQRLAGLMAAKALPLGVSAIAAEAALAALADFEHVRMSVRRNADDRQEFYNHANARMLRVIDSQTNFAMLDTARPAADVVAHFRAHGLMLPPPVAQYDRYVRVSMGTAAEMNEFWRVWDLMPVIHSHG